MTKKEKIGIVILNYNGTKDTIDCLKSIVSSNLRNFKVFVEIVDNGSSSNHYELLKENLVNLSQLGLQKDINFHIERSERNVGFTGGNNLGIAKILDKNVDNIFFINNDTKVDKNTIRILVNVLRQRKTIGMVSPKIYFWPGLEFHKDRYRGTDLGNVIWYAGGLIDWNNVYFSHRGVDEVDRGQYNLAGSTEFITGCAMMVKTEVLVKTGLFDEKYFLYLEDVDLSMRVKQAGYALCYEPKAMMWHKNASSSNQPGSPIHVYYQTRNRLLFGFKYSLSWRTKAALIKESLKMIVFDSIRRKPVLDYYLNKLGKN